MAQTMVMSLAALLLLPVLIAASTGPACPANYCLQRIKCIPDASFSSAKRKNECPKGEFQPSCFQCVQTMIQGNACALEGETCNCPGGKVDFGNYGEFDGQDHGDGHWTAQITGTATTSCAKASFSDWESLPEPTKSSVRKGCRCHPADSPWAAVTKASTKPTLCTGTSGYVKPTCITVNFAARSDSELAHGGHMYSQPQQDREVGMLNASEWESTGLDRFTFEYLMLGGLGQLNKQTHPRKCNFYKPSTTGKKTATEFQAWSVKIPGLAIPNATTRKVLTFGAQVQVPDAYEAVKMWDEIIFQNSVVSLPVLDIVDPKNKIPAQQRLPLSCFDTAVNAQMKQYETEQKPCTYETAAQKLANSGVAADKKTYTRCWSQPDQIGKNRRGLNQGWNFLDDFLAEKHPDSKGECSIATTATTTVSTTVTTTTTSPPPQGTTPRPGNTNSGSVGGSTLPPGPDTAKVTSNAQSLAWSLASASLLLLAIMEGVSQ